MTTQDLGPFVRAERSALADALDELALDAWDAPTLCDAWTVHDVVAHLTAAARTPTLPWLVNMVHSACRWPRRAKRSRPSPSSSPLRGQQPNHGTWTVS